MFSQKRHWISWTCFRPDPTRPDLDLGAQFSYIAWDNSPVNILRSKEFLPRWIVAQYPYVYRTVYGKP